MKLLNTRPIVFATFLLSLAGCRPDEEPVQPVDNTPASIVTPIQLPMVDGVYGAMYSIRVMQVFNGEVTRSERASAVFYDNPSNTATATEHASAGLVAVNNISLNQGNDNGYDRVAVEGQIFEDLGYEDSVSWVIQGDETVPSFSFAWSKVFPTYIGEFPAIITRANGLNLTFDDNTVIAADSIFVAISAGDKLIVKRYPAHAGQVNISSNELMQLRSCTAGKPGYLQISASVDDVFILVNRPTAAVKQTTEIRTVVIK